MWYIRRVILAEGVIHRLPAGVSTKHFNSYRVYPIRDVTRHPRNVRCKVWQVISLMEFDWFAPSVTGV
jgi:hypothetical protein